MIVAIISMLTSQHLNVNLVIQLVWPAKIVNKMAAWLAYQVKAFKKDIVLINVPVIISNKIMFASYVMWLVQLVWILLIKIVHLALEA